MRNSMRFSSGTPALRSTIACCTSSAAHRVDDAPKLDDAAIAGALDDAAMVNGDCGINQIAAQRAQSRQGSIFVRASQPAITDHIRDQNRRNFPGFAHGAPSGHHAA